MAAVIVFPVARIRALGGPDDPAAVDAAIEQVIARREREARERELPLSRPQVRVVR